MESGRAGGSHAASASRDGKTEAREADPAPNRSSQEEREMSHSASY